MKEIIHVSLALEGMEAIERDIKKQRDEIKAKLTNGQFDDAHKLCEAFERDYNVKFPRTVMM